MFVFVFQNTCEPSLRRAASFWRKDATSTKATDPEKADNEVKEGKEPQLRRRRTLYRPLPR
jgi:hypothetical protein